VFADGGEWGEEEEQRAKEQRAKEQASQPGSRSPRGFPRQPSPSLWTICILLEYKAPLPMRIRHASLRSGGEPGNDSCFQHLVPITFQIEPPSNNRASGMHRKRSIEVGQQCCVWGADVARHILKRDDEAGEERARCKRGRNKVPKPKASHCKEN
jgi:hypothetical protein